MRTDFTIGPKTGCRRNAFAEGKEGGKDAALQNENGTGPGRFRSAMGPVPFKRETASPFPQLVQDDGRLRPRQTVPGRQLAIRAADEAGGDEPGGARPGIGR